MGHLLSPNHALGYTYSKNYDIVNQILDNKIKFNKELMYSILFFLLLIFLDILLWLWLKMTVK